jgi:hypothetical protein
MNRVNKADKNKPKNVNRVKADKSKKKPKSDKDKMERSILQN